MRLPPGKRLGPYEIIALIGSGGMADVYRARDTRLGRSVAVKVLPSSASADKDGLRRLRQEAQATSALNHANIVTVYDVGLLDDVAYIVCELLDGGTLRQTLNRGPLVARQALEYGAQIAHGLAAAHRKGILHRDIKPENVFVTSDGVVKILDFGLTKLTSAVMAEEQSTVTGTASGVLLGTPGYVSPEQIREQRVDHRTDIFSLGVVLYEMLAGRRPFQGDSAAETLSAILTEQPPELSHVRPGLPVALDRVVSGCLEKNPEERFESASDLALSLRAVLPLLERARAARVEPARRGAQTTRSQLAALVVIVLATLAIFSAGWTANTETLAAYERITFGRGTIGSARFRPGNTGVVYDASLNGQTRELFAAAPGAPEARALGVRGAEILSISRTGEMAVC